MGSSTCTCAGSYGDSHFLRKNFVSENVLAGLNNSLVGTPITVYVSKTDPGKYMVDVSAYQ